MKKFEGILFCTDLDGTLYRDDRTVSEENLAALEYFTYLFGIDYVNGRLIWSCSAEGADSVYEQKLFGRTYTLRLKLRF